METRKIFRCFISSPGDCQIERESCKKVIENINNGLAKHLGVNFETFMWEYDVLPDMGRNGQEIIDEYAKKSTYDIFIGIMKNRSGQPTLKAGSGTEHEFLDAMKMKMNSHDSLPQILFFFGKENIDPEDFDFDQYEKVREFKSSNRKNGLYIDFEGQSKFEELLAKKLELFVKDHSPLEGPSERIQQVDLILTRLEADLSNSLKTYNEKSPIWLDPIISSKREIPTNPTKNDDNRVGIQVFIDDPKDIVIKAPSEFGLTSLGHFLKLEAWKCGKTFLYIDSVKTKKHKVVKDIYKEIENYYFSDIGKISCIIIDSINFEENGTMQLLKNICDTFKTTPLIILNTIESSFFLRSDEDDKVEITREFVPYYLLPLPQNEVRKLVTSYSNIRTFSGDSELILSRVTKDLEVLNMHRTPKNCISILRASSKTGLEYSPVNRTKLLETILNTIFEEYEIPTYNNKKPDVKDCSFVLGYFCEILVFRNDFEFSDEFFTSVLKKFCDSNYIDLDLNYLLSVLLDNSIFGRKSSGYLYFKSSYWVFYFIAQRMNMNKEFLGKIFDNKKYIDYPEIIEFYTGIDRNKEDALNVIHKDISETLMEVRAKVNISDSLNPYKSITWNPNIDALLREQAKISENVISSGLPDEVKDRYDDKNYNQMRPYNQVINSVMRDYSFLVLMRQVSAASRALRNSDFVDSVLKKELLDKIIQSWNEINKLLIVLSPLLADKGNVLFEGALFQLEDEDFTHTDENEKRLAVLLSLPTNVVKFFKDDLFSSKMAPLLIDRASGEANSLIRHEIMILLISERPKGWNAIIDSYIVSLDKNSFFLSDVLLLLSFQRDYKTVEMEERRMIDLLARKCRAKHIFKSNNPDLGLINRLQRLERGGNSSYS